MGIKRTLMLGTISCSGLISCEVLAKDKPVVPSYVLRAHTVAVMIDPDAGIAPEDPNANQTAQKDVEAALFSWGRFVAVLRPQEADLVIVLRKGHPKLIEQTVSDPRQNSRPGAITRTPDGISVGAQRGTQAGPSGGRPDVLGEPHPQLEMGGADDSFEVFEGQSIHPLDGPVGWRWVRKEGLHSHDVPAVQEFRKAIVEAEKQAAKHP